MASFKDDRQVVTGSRNLRIWDVQYRIVKRAIQGTQGHQLPYQTTSELRAVERIRPSSPGTLTTGRWYYPLVKHTSWVISVCFFPDDRSLVSLIVLWGAQTGAIPTTLHGHSGGVLSVAFNPDGISSLGYLYRLSFYFSIGIKDWVVARSSG